MPGDSALSGPLTQAVAVGSERAEAVLSQQRPSVGGSLARRGITHAGLHLLALPVRGGVQRTPAIGR
jgi:hypothetical protein